MISQEAAVSLFSEIAGTRRSDIILPAGSDDCGAILLDRHRALVVTTDFTNFSPHSAALKVGSLYDRARMLVWHNVSDLLSTGAAPLCFVAAIGLPRTCSEQDVIDLARGLRDGASAAGVVLLGGDTKESPQLSLCGTAFGLRTRTSLWRRDGGRTGDDLYVTGPIGGVSAAVYTLMSGDTDSVNVRSKIAEALLNPILPVPIFKKLESLRVRIAALDVSDGFGADLHRFAESSHVGVEIYSEQIPIHHLAMETAEHFGVSPLEFVFGLGGDLQFIFSAARKHRKRIEETGAYRIGQLLSAGSAMLKHARGTVPLPSFGHRDFEHLSSREEFRQLVTRRGLP
jgi:thiamine-monophosphate kinase